MAIKLASLFIELGVKSDKLTAELKKGTKSTQAWAKTTAKAADTAKKAFVGATAAVTAYGVGLTAVYSATAAGISQQAKLANRLGTTAENLKVLGLAARAAGVDQEGVNDTLADFTERLGEARIDGGEPAEALNLLRLSAEELAKQDPAEALREVLEAMEALPDAGTRAATGAKLFGDQGIQITGLLAAEFEKAEQKIADLGGALSELEVRQVKDATASVKDLTLIGELASERFTARLAPAVNVVAKQLFESAKQGGQLNTVLDNLVDSSVDGLASFADAAGRILQFVDGRPELAAGGVIGYVLGGKLGFLAGTVATASFDTLSATFDALKAKFDITLSDADRAEIDLRRIVSKMRLLSVPGIGAIFGLGDVEGQLERLELERREIATVLSDMGEFGRITAIQFNTAESAISVAGDALRALSTELKAAQDSAANDPLIAPIGPTSPGSAASAESIGGYDDGPLQYMMDQNQQLLDARAAYFAQALAAEAQFQATWTLFEKVGANDRLSIFSNETSGALAVLSKHSRKMFEINKAVGLANATVSIATGISKALELPFPANMAAAATVALQGAAQIQTITSAKYGQSKIATPIKDVDADPPSLPAVTSNSSAANDSDTNKSVIVQIYPPIGASQEQIDEAINIAVQRNVDSGQMIPETEIVFNNRSIA